MKIDSVQQYIKLRTELTQERGRLSERIRQLDQALGQIPPVSISAVQGAAATRQPKGIAPGKRTMSPEARARIAAAQKARWAAQKGNLPDKASVAGNQAGAAERPKRKMSAAARKSIAEAARRRWAAAKAAGRSRL